MPVLAIVSNRFVFGICFPGGMTLYVLIHRSIEALARTDKFGVIVGIEMKFKKLLGRLNIMREFPQA